MAALKENAITKLVSIAGIDAKTVAITSLYTVPTGKRLIVTSIVIRVTAFTAGGKSVQAIASFGGNSATYDDFLNSVTYTVAANNVRIEDAAALASAFPSYAAAAIFKISIETGSDATTETWAVDVFGYLVDA